MGERLHGKIEYLKENSENGFQLPLTQVKTHHAILEGWGCKLAAGKWSAVSGTTLIVALLQSACTAVLTISGLRVAIGLSALAAASGIYAPAKGFHQDAIRIPMLILATISAVLNLGVLAWKANQLCTLGYKVVRQDTVPAEGGAQIDDNHLRCNPYRPSLDVFNVSWANLF